MVCPGEALIRKGIRSMDDINWYHEFEFPYGTAAKSQAPDVHEHRRIWAFIEHSLENIDFQDKTVLDIGAWDGYFSFYAEQKGANPV